MRIQPHVYDSNVAVRPTYRALIGSMILVSTSTVIPFDLHPMISVPTGSSSIAAIAASPAESNSGLS